MIFFIIFQLLQDYVIYHIRRFDMMMCDAAVPTSHRRFLLASVVISLLTARTICRHRHFARITGLPARRHFL